ncbi:F0F1 ATP synthase subunit A [Pseudorhodoferax sp.]|uniref:F0F1 ATP synthase subunit A n=1 Tax=Pseudorhodoferax sp. TaxID=1993553 RepID=UPI0039E4A80D
MMRSPLQIEPLFHIGPVPVTQPVVATWAIMAVLTIFSVLLTRRLALRPGRVQAAAELVAGAIDSQIADVMHADPAPYRALVGTILVFILAANWSGALPGVEPPTAHLETDAALALIVLGATIYHGVRANGLSGYLRSFAEPSWAMIPLNLVEQLTRTLSLTVRLFGNVMSGVFIIGILLSLAGLLVPIPLMALDLLTGAIQAYIFAILACVFIGAAVSEGQDGRPGGAPGKPQGA